MFLTFSLIFLAKRNRPLCFCKIICSHFYIRVFFLSLYLDAFWVSQFLISYCVYVQFWVYVKFIKNSTNQHHHIKLISKKKKKCFFFNQSIFFRCLHSFYIDLFLISFYRKELYTNNNTKYFSTASCNVCQSNKSNCRWT